MRKARMTSKDMWELEEKKRLEEIDSRDYTNSKVVKDWDDLEGMENEHYYIKLGDGNGWINPKDEDVDIYGYYLSTHTFYEKSHKDYEGTLRKCGFDVKLESWG